MVPKKPEKSTPQKPSKNDKNDKNDKKDKITSDKNDKIDRIDGIETQEQKEKLDKIEKSRLKVEQIEGEMYVRGETIHALRVAMNCKSEKKVSSGSSLSQAENAKKHLKNLNSMHVKVAVSKSSCKYVRCLCMYLRLMFLFLSLSLCLVSIVLYHTVSKYVLTNHTTYITYTTYSYSPVLLRSVLTLEFLYLS